jgi:hypothetical protein
MGQKKQAKIINFRIYSTKWYSYDFSECEEIMKRGPLVLDNFPENGWTLTCYFGPIPESIEELKYAIDGYGLKRKSEIFSQSKLKKTLGEYIVGLKADPEYFPRSVWATTIVIEKPIDPYEFRMIKENGDISGFETHQFFRENYRKLAFSEVFDKTVLSCLTEMEQVLFDELVISEMALLIDDEIAVAFPKNMGTQREGWQCCDGKAFDKEKISALMQNVNSLRFTWFDNVAHWRVAMVMEQDPLRKFYFGFICLEILTNELSKEIVTTCSILGNPVKISPNKIPSESKFKKMDLWNKFFLIAEVLNPSGFAKDQADFKICKDFRNKMSHEGIYEGENPPLEKLDSLLDFYLLAILRSI